MKFYGTYYREQRVGFEIEADTEEEAMALAWIKAEAFDLLSADDESDDDGEIILEPMEEECPRKKR